MYKVEIINVLATIKKYKYIVNFDSFYYDN